jgi:hypothetical protein
VAAGQSERVLAHASDLVVTLLGDRLDDSTRVRGAVQRSLMLRIKDYIHQRFPDRPSGPPRSPLPSTSPPATCTSFSKPATRRSRCTPKASAWTGPGETSWTRGLLTGPFPRSPAAAGSATSAASTAPASRPTQSVPASCATHQPPRHNPRRPSPDIPGTARHAQRAETVRQYELRSNTGPVRTGRSAGRRTAHQTRSASAPIRQGEPKTMCPIIAVRDREGR